jgi:cytochrome c oxidase cbb3-type subunit 3
MAHIKPLSQSCGPFEGARPFSMIGSTTFSSELMQLPRPGTLSLSKGVLAKMSFHRAGAVVVVCTICLFGGAFAHLHAQSDNHPIRGAERFIEYCAGCHGVDGKGGDKAASLTTNQSARNRSDEELFRIVRDGTTEGMPPFGQIGDANIAAVVRYLRMLQDEAANGSAPAAITGDVNAGRALYFGKAQCSDCHMIGGKGGFIASDLTVYGRNRSPEAIRNAIVTTDNPLVLSSRVVSVSTRGGQKLTGVLRNEDNFDIAIQTEDGRYHLLARTDLPDVHYTDHSLMPRDYGTKLSSEDLNDIAAFLYVSSRKALGSGKDSMKVEEKNEHSPTQH